MENVHDFCNVKEAITCYHHSLFAVSKDKWNTKEGTGKSMKNTLYVCTLACQKAPFGLKQCQTAKNKPVALVQRHQIVSQ